MPKKVSMLKKAQERRKRALKRLEPWLKLYECGTPQWLRISQEMNTLERRAYAGQR